MGYSTCGMHKGDGPRTCDNCDRCPRCEGFEAVRVDCRVCCGRLTACPACLPKIRAHVREARTAARRRGQEAML